MGVKKDINFILNDFSSRLAKEDRFLLSDECFSDYEDFPTIHLHLHLAGNLSNLYKLSRLRISVDRKVKEIKKSSGLYLLIKAGWDLRKCKKAIKTLWNNSGCSQKGVGFTNFVSSLRWNYKSKWFLTYKNLSSDGVTNACRCIDFNSAISEETIIKKKRQFVRLTFDIDSDLFRSFKIEAIRRNTTMKSLINTQIERLVSREYVL